MELTIKGPGHSVMPGPPLQPKFIVNVGPAKLVSIFCDFVLTNHRVNRRERIIGCELHLKRRFFFFWDKTLFSTPVMRYSFTSNDPIDFNLGLEPLSAPTIVTVTAHGEMPEAVVRRLPKTFKMVAVFHLVGPVKRTERILETITHDPKILKSGTGSSWS